VADIQPRDLIQALYEKVTFPPGIASKRFVRDMACRPADAEISDRAARYAWRIAYIYRRQLPKAIADESVARKVDHQWEETDQPAMGRMPRLTCSRCERPMYSERERNAPCPGPPEPKPEPKRRRVTVEQRVVDGAVEFECHIAQESLFGAEPTEAKP
jgi:hypothetical protein